MRLLRLVRALAGRLLPRPDREFILGDLDELYGKWTRSEGRVVATRRYLVALAASVIAQRRNATASRHTGTDLGKTGPGGREPTPHRLTDQVRSIRRPRAPGPAHGSGTGGGFGSLVSDARHALRSLRRDPVFTVTAVACLALGIGASTAIFSVVNGVLLRSFPYAEPRELVVLREYRIERGARDPGDPYPWVSYLNALDWRAQASTLQDLALSAGAEYLMLGGAAPERVQGSPVTPGYFELLGTPAALGRTLVPGESAPVVVLSDRLWRRAFGADPDVVGRPIRLNGEPFEVVGVMPRDFSATDSMPDELWVPIDAAPRGFVDRWKEHREMRAPVRAVARLAPGATLDDARTELEVIVERLRREHPEANEGHAVQIVPQHENLVGRVRSTLLMLLGAVGLLLLIACANVANLLLARVTARQGELAVRSALGAGRWRIARGLLTESTLLSLAGGGCGLLIALWAVRLIQATSPGDIPRLEQVGLDVTVLAFTFLVSLGVGWLFGLAPALQASRAGTRAVLQRRAGLRGGAAPGARLRGVLVVAEVAVALVLLIGAGLLVNGFRTLWTFDWGFEPQGVLTVDLHLSSSTPTATPLDDAAFFRRLYERLGTLPSVESVGGVGTLPGDPAPYYVNVVAGDGASDVTLSAAADAGEHEHADESGAHSACRPVGGDYFQTLRIPLRAGRFLRAGDTGAVVINEALARELWPDRPAVGRLLLDLDLSRPMEVVGVVADQRYRGVDPAPRPEMFLPLDGGCGGSYGLDLVVRTTGDPLQLVGAVRQAVADIDPERPIGAIRTMEQVLGDSVARPRFYMAVFGLFGAVALALSAAGIFGVASYSVTRRTHEVGVRIALGARPRHVLGLIVGRGAVLTGVGIVIGLAVARASTRFVEGLLYGVTPTDPATFLTVALLLGATALIAFWLPARRAAAVDPVVTLRRE